RCGRDVLPSSFEGLVYTGGTDFHDARIDLPYSWACVFYRTYYYAQPGYDEYQEVIGADRRCAIARWSECCTGSNPQYARPGRFDFHSGPDALFGRYRYG